MPTPVPGSADVSPGAAADLTLALELAQAADRISMARFRAEDLVVSTKPDLTPVTEADRAVETALRALLAQHRPADAILGEEFGGQAEGSDVRAGSQPARQWILDPIDATKNYVRGVPVWATLIGLVIDGRPALGVVSAPALGRLWWGGPGLGAWVRGPEGERAIAVSGVGALTDASFSFSDPVGWPAGALGRLTRGTWRTRAYGDFWSHLLVAEGAVDVAAEPELNSWDIAALIPIVVAAGGRVTGYDGSPALTAGSAVTSNGLLHDAVLGLIAG